MTDYLSWRATYSWQKALHFNEISPVTKGYLSWETILLWPMEWSFRTGSTVICNIHTAVSPNAEVLGLAHTHAVDTGDIGAGTHTSREAGGSQDSGTFWIAQNTEPLPFVSLLSYIIIQEVWDRSAKLHIKKLQGQRNSVLLVVTIPSLLPKCVSVLSF